MDLEYIKIMENVANQIINLTDEFTKEIEIVRKSIEDDIYIYNPLVYAKEMHYEYIKKFAVSPIENFFLGMNPGPFGMAQTGIPFGEVNTVKDYLKINEIIDKPDKEHPNRKVEGLDIKRSEISGQRLWSLIQDYYPNALDMRSHIYIANYCPLLFLSPIKTAKNITPDKLTKQTRDNLDKVCDKYLFETINILKCKRLIGIGKYAQRKLKNDTIPYYSILHPSPASPLANKGWKEKALSQLIEIGVNYKQL